MSEKEVKLTIRKHKTDGEMLELLTVNKWTERLQLWAVCHSDILPDGVSGDDNEWDARLIFGEE